MNQIKKIAGARFVTNLLAIAAVCAVFAVKANQIDASEHADDARLAAVINLN